MILIVKHTFGLVFSELWFVIIALMIIGLMVGCGLIPTFKGLLQGAL